MKKCKYRSEQERYCARKNREMDFFQANNRSFDYADKAAYALTEKAGATLGTDSPEGIADGATEEMAWARYLDKATVSFEMPFGELKEVIQRAWQSGVDYGREQCGLEALFEGEV
ncbi:TPA: hypothetical protein ACIBS5_002865 [Salmonella enterica subsp. diarizonae serovar 60-67:z35:-]